MAGKSAKKSVVKKAAKRAPAATKAKPVRQQQEQGLASGAFKGVDFDVDVVDGKVVLTLIHAGSDGEIEVKGRLSVGRLLDKLEAKIPGNWDKAPIAILKASLENL